MPENYITSENENGSCSISEEVISVMVSASIAEVDGVAGLSNNIAADLSELLGKKSVSKGIKISFADNTVVIDALILVRYGYGVTGVARKVQEEIASAVESMSGLKSRVNVHVVGIAFDKAAV